MNVEQPGSPDSVVPTGESQTTESELDLESQDLSDDGQTTEPDEVEEELDGVKLRGKKDALDRIKSERLMQQDYTRKTQEAAEVRREAEARQNQLREVEQFQRSNLQEFARLTAIDDRLGQFQQVNWQALSNQDPVQAQQLHIEYTQLQTMRGQLVNSLTQKQQQQAFQAQQSNAQRWKQAQEVVQREIKDWSPAKSVELENYVKASGLDVDQLRQFIAYQPSFVKMIDKSNRYDQLMKQRAQKAPTDPATPATRVGGGSAASTRKLSAMSDAEYVAARRNYIKNHR
jgi:hypothetical protein